MGIILPRIEVKTSGVNSEVFIDGAKIEKVRAIYFTHTPGKLPMMSLDFAAADLYLDGQFVPALPKPFDNWYKAKTPPEMGEVLRG